MTHGRYHIRPRGGTAAEWTADNPILWDRELGVETDTLRAKLGDGVTAWNDLDYAFDEAGQVAAEAAIRAAADTALQAEIDAAETDITTLDTALTAEASARAAADTALDTRLDAVEALSLAGVELAYAENNTGSQTTVPVFSTYTGISGATIVVPPTDGPVVIEYGAEMRVGTSGGGVGFLVLFSYTIDGVGTQLHQSALGYVAAQITAWSGTNEVKGRHRLPPSATERILGLRTTLIRDSGGVTLFIGNGILGGSPTYLAAMGA